MSVLASFLIYQRGYALLGLSVLNNVPVEPLLVVFHFPCLISSLCTLAFLMPPLLLQTAFLYSSQAACPCSHSLHMSFFSLSLTSGSLFSYASFQLPLLVFLYHGTESSCVLIKASLKSCQFSFSPFYARTASQGISPSELFSRSIINIAPIIVSLMSSSALMRAPVPITPLFWLV